MDRSIDTWANGVKKNSFLPMTISSSSLAMNTIKQSAREEHFPLIIVDIVPSKTLLLSNGLLVKETFFESSILPLEYSYNCISTEPVMG